MSFLRRVRQVLDVEGVLGFIERFSWGQAMSTTALGALAWFWARVNEAPDWAIAILIGVWSLVMLWFATFLAGRQVASTPSRIVDHRGLPALGKRAASWVWYSTALLLGGFLTWSLFTVFSYTVAPLGADDIPADLVRHEPPASAFIIPASTQPREREKSIIQQSSSGDNSPNISSISPGAVVSFGQQGGQTAHTIVNSGPVEQHLTSLQRTMLNSIAANFPKSASVSLVVEAVNDRHALIYAREILAVFAAHGVLSDDRLVTRLINENPEVTGVFVLNRGPEDEAFPIAQKIADAIAVSGMKVGFEGGRGDRLEPGKIKIVVQALDTP